MIYRFQTTVVKIAERFERRWVDGRGKDAEFENISRGWFITLEGSHESLGVGAEKPPLSPGDKVQVSLQRIP